MRCQWVEFARLKQLPDGRCFLLTGSEDYFKPEAIALIHDAFAAGRVVDSEKLDARSLKADEILKRAQTASLFSAGRFLVASHAEEIKNAEQKAIAKLLPRIAAGTCLVLATSETGKSEPVRLAADLVSACSKQGAVVDFPAFTAGDAQVWATQTLKKHGRQIVPAAARLLIERAGADLLRLNSEIEKLLLYTEGKPAVELADIEALVARAAVERIFSLIDAIAERRAKDSLKSLEHAIEDQETPEHIASLLHRQFRLLWQTKQLVDGGWKLGQPIPKDLLDALPATGNVSSELGRPWLARKYVQQASRLSWRQLEEALRGLQAFDLTTKGIEGKVRDSRLALELLILQLCQGLAMPVWED